MALEELSSLDYFLVGVDILILLAIISYISTNWTSISKCRSIIVKEERLKIWRYSLYTSVTSIWLLGIFTFVTRSLLRIPLHGLFLVSMVYMLHVSLPSWLCKRRGYGGMCNCDVYKYADFPFMIVLGFIGGLLYTFLSIELASALLYFGFYLLIISFIYFFIPEKEIKPLKYPPELRIATIDEFQAFVTQNIHQKKLITTLKDTCDFCVIQVEELQKVPIDLLKQHLRIFDLSVEIDPLLRMSLNIDDVTKLPVPSTRIYDSGMEIDLREGVVLSLELQDLIY